jgi:hypothetical protein
MCAGACVRASLHPPLVAAGLFARRPLCMPLFALFARRPLCTRPPVARRSLCTPPSFTPSLHTALLARRPLCTSRHASSSCTPPSFTPSLHATLHAAHCAPTLSSRAVLFTPSPLCTPSSCVRACVCASLHAAPVARRPPPSSPHTLSRKLSSPLTHTLSRKLSPSHSLTHSLFHTVSLSHTCTLSHTLSAARNEAPCNEGSVQRATLNATTPEPLPAAAAWSCKPVPLASRRLFHW